MIHYINQIFDNLPQGDKPKSMFRIHKTKPKARKGRPRKPQYYVTIVHANGNVLFTSECYTRKHNAWKVIYALLSTFATRLQHKVVVDKSGKVAVKYHAWITPAGGVKSKAE